MMNYIENFGLCQIVKPLRYFLICLIRSISVKKFVVRLFVLRSFKSFMVISLKLRKTPLLDWISMNSKFVTL